MHRILFTAALIALVCSHVSEATCPPPSYYCEYRAGDPISVQFTQNRSDFCTQSENPSEIGDITDPDNAYKWVAYLDSLDPSTPLYSLIAVDMDLMWSISCDTDWLTCGWVCDESQEEFDDQLEYVWSGTMDLTIAGEYHLTLTVKNPDRPPCGPTEPSCANDCPVNDAPVVKYLTINVLCCPNCGENCCSGDRPCCNPDTEKCEKKCGGESGQCCLPDQCCNGLTGQCDGKCGGAEGTCCDMTECKNCQDGECVSYCEAGQGCCDGTCFDPAMKTCCGDQLLDGTGECCGDPPQLCAPCTCCTAEGCQPYQLTDMTVTADYYPLPPDNYSQATLAVVTNCQNSPGFTWTIETATPANPLLDPITGAKLSSSTGRTVTLTAGKMSGEVEVTACPSNCPGQCITRKVKIGCGGCRSNDCSVFEMKLSSIEMRFSFGSSSRGEAGAMEVEAQTVSAALYSPASLVAGVTQKEVTILRDEASGAIRQVLAPAVLLDVTVLESPRVGYAVSYYPAAARQLVPGTPYYDVISETPFRRIEVENPDPGMSETRLQVIELQDSVEVKRQIAELTTVGNPTWSLVSKNPQGQILRQEELVKETLLEDKRIEKRTISETDGTVRHREWTTYTTYTCGAASVEQITKRQLDPEDANLTITRSYWPDGAQKCGRVRSVANDDGSWVMYDYDAEGRTVLEVRSWLDEEMPEVPIYTAAHATTYNYTPLTGDSADPQDMHRPRIFEEWVYGILVSQTYYTYQRIEGVLVETVTRKGPDTDLTTTTSYYSDTDPEYQAGKVYQTQHPDGRTETYTYESGTYNADQPDIEAAFEPGPGPDLRTTVTAGPAVDRRTTRQRTVTLANGSTALDITQVLDAGDIYATIDWTRYTYDAQGRQTAVHYSNGTYRTIEPSSCCTAGTETDVDGKVIESYPDALGRIWKRVKRGWNGTVDTKTVYGFDAMGRELSETISDDPEPPALSSITLISSTQYDLAGRVQSSTDTSGLTTEYDYGITGGDRVVTETLPGGAQRITTYYRDGRVKSIAGDAVVNKFYSYGVDLEGNRWTTELVGSDAPWLTPFVTSTATNLLGQTTSVIEYQNQSMVDDYVTALHHYNGKGQLVRTEKISCVWGKLVADTIYEYDPLLGDVVRSGLDIDGQERVLDIAAVSKDRIKESTTQYEKDGAGVWWQTTINKVYTAEVAGGAPVITETVRHQLTGLGCTGNDCLTESTETLDPHGNKTVTKTTVNRVDRTVSRTTEYPDSVAAEVSITKNGLLESTTSKTGVATSFVYDDLGRPWKACDSRMTGCSETHYNSLGQVDWIKDAAGNQATYEYYPAENPNAGYLKAIEVPGGNRQYFSYTVRGEKYRTWGDTTYPVEYGYDQFGRLMTVTTFRGAGGPEWPSGIVGDTTEFYYGPQNSNRWLMTKYYPDNSFVQYGYTPDGKLKSRIWARQSGGSNLVTNYGYDPSTGDLTEIDYSDNTPDVAFRYYRSGRIWQVDDVMGTRTFAYNPADLQLDTETITGTGDYYSKTISRSYEGIGDAVSGRLNGFSISGYGDVRYYYSSVGRLERITGPGLPAYGTVYSQLAESELVEHVRYMSADQTTLASAQTNYEPNRNLVDYIENRMAVVPADPVSRYNYANDSRGRRTALAITGTAFAGGSGDHHWDFDYNDRNELTGGDRRTGIEPNSGTHLSPSGDYDYAYDSIGNRTSSNVGNASPAMTYATNGLNQYTATVTPSESFDFDADGNLTGADQTFMGLLWDAENRLTQIEPDNPNANSKLLKFAYDYLGRRVRKQIFAWNATTEIWEDVAESDQRFVYDGWNVVLVLDGKNGNAVFRKYTWGLDLSGRSGDASLGGIHDTGGVGGLLATVETGGTHEGMYWYLYDANGNVGQVLNTSDVGNITVAAKYEYDPFGNLVEKWGTYADVNPFRFSTKWLDAETGLHYYGYRYYSSTLGRWISRDPLEERGGTNLYGFANNNPINNIDLFGLWGDDIHYELTMELAEFAGIACAETIAEGARRPDLDGRRPGTIGVAAVGYHLFAGGWSRAKERTRLMAEWHFPADPDGEVRRNSDVANAKVRAGLATCDIDDFGEGLHVLQDSWSHQGRPYIAGVGHGRGVEWQTGMGMAMGVTLPYGAYRRTDGSPHAATTSGTDDVKLFPADARETAMRTWAYLKEFKKRCRCACERPGTHYQRKDSRSMYSEYRVTSKSALQKDDKAIVDWLQDKKRFVGENVNDGERIRR